MKMVDALFALNSNTDAIKQMGATALYLFGSTARDEAGPDSDIDLFIDYDAGSRFNAFDLIGIKLFLEERLGASVDVTTRDSLHPRLRAGIEKTAVQVF